jgi:hypothetical protein
MPKPTSTALNVNDKLSDGNVNPPHGDAPGPGQAKRKPSVTSAGVARPSHLAALNTADHAEKTTSNHNADATVNVHFNNNDNSYSFEPSSYEVPKQGTVRLKQDGGGDDVKVLASQDKGNGPEPVSVFINTAETNPYPADGTTYQLDSSITGEITLTIQLSTSRMAASNPGDRHCGDGCRGGANGTINVKP